MSDVRESRSGAQAIERALAVLRCFESGERTQGISELARRTGLTVSTTHRVTRALADGGLLMQVPRGDRYQLGPTLAVLGARAADQLGYDQALPLLAELAESTGESVNLGIRTGTDVQVVLDVPSTQPLRFDQPPGTRVPLYASAMGKCLLAAAADLEAEAAALGELTAHTDRTVTTTKALLADLRAVRERGWALNDEERNPGVRAIAVAVRTDTGTIAAIAVQGPTVRITEDRFATLANQLTHTARRVAPLLAATR
ncbi:IclR family transcriptional regulator [Actinokineospora fastidiosa]|uniref:IclR family transcriptional regulator n=1 Tax=Actinokineospora fastidiosa TaxID=1816 RepID=A0A918GHP8_9PSEU|nr:IclR family transcriptional regulator [Actinokineospora fastidiosa]GGS36537.1 IclR family transcriptional regulator [Actinokineospora fastidiosa]